MVRSIWESKTFSRLGPVLVFNSTKPILPVHLDARAARQNRWVRAPALRWAFILFMRPRMGACQAFFADFFGPRLPGGQGLQKSQSPLPVRQAGKAA